MTWLLRIIGCSSSTHFDGTLVPMEEPSTASIPDIRNPLASMWVSIARLLKVCVQWEDPDRYVKSGTTVSPGSGMKRMGKEAATNLDPTHGAIAPRSCP